MAAAELTCETTVGTCFYSACLNPICEDPEWDGKLSEDVDSHVPGENL